MHWLNLPTTIIRSPEYVGSEPTIRATWFNLMAYCAEQENGGEIASCQGWKCRQWQQTCGVTLEEVQQSSELWQWIDGRLVVKFYPDDKQAEVQRNRESGRNGGKKTSPAKSDAARVNGSLGGRSKTQAETQAPESENPSETQALTQALTQAVEANNPSGNPTERKGKEGNDMEGNYPLTPKGDEDGVLLKVEPEACTPGKLWNPSPRQIQINRWFKRRDTTAWSAKECRAFKGIPSTPDEDWALLEMYYIGPGENRWPKHDVYTLLNNWLGEIDKARRWSGTSDTTGNIEHDFSQDANPERIDMNDEILAGFAKLRRQRIMDREIEPETDEERAMLNAD